MVNDQFKYIGLGFASLWISASFLFLLRISSLARYIKHNEVLQISWRKYSELQDQALDYREKILNIEMKTELRGERSEESKLMNFDDVILKNNI